MKLIELFLCFLKVGLFSVGGGYAAIPLIRDQAVNVYGWLADGEFTDLVAIAEMTPGPIALNAATFIGNRLCGLGGAVVASVGCVLPSIVVCSILVRLYYRYRKLDLLQGVLASLRPAVVALIASAGVTMLLPHLLPRGGWQVLVCLALFVAALLLIRLKKVSPILVMASVGMVSLLLRLCGVVLP